MKVLLVEPKKNKGWGKNNQYVGLLKIANYYKSNGHEIQYVVAPDLPDFYPDLICITSMFTYFYKSVWEAVRMYKAMYPKATVQLGGIYATLCPEHAKKSGADEVAIGQHKRAKEYPPDPSVLPYPQDFAYLFTSYGCNRACTYCATHLLYGAGIRQRETNKVVEDIMFLGDKGYRKIYLGDDNILADSQNHINKICEKILAKRIKIEIHIPGGMSAKDFTQETAYLMRAAGVKEISFAIESIDRSVLRKMGRENNVKVDDLRTALEKADKAKFKRSESNVYFIIGMPYQKVEGMVDTLVCLLREGVWAHPQRLTPIPGTIDYKRMKLENIDYADLYYKNFVAPGQDNFTSEDLNDIYKMARFFNIGLRYTSGFDWLDDSKDINRIFKKKLLGG